ncbi:MAG: hypothetical protein NZ988_04930 [Thaumarchaeota archaeon]|nr:hypothetical protein [Candidatus Calditenuaceae archaeon]MDW8187370.1 hypothetical protein [Nitrososphaerota archaeon]
MRKVIAVVAVVVVIGALTFFIFGQRGPREIILEAWEFGYNGTTGGPTIKLKAGEEIRITLINRGGVAHEIIVVKDQDREAFLTETHKLVRRFIEKGVTDPIVIHASPEWHVSYRIFAVTEMVIGGNIVLGFRTIDHIHVERGQVFSFTMKLDKPGTYNYVCGLTELTFPETHADRGMYGTIIVEA